MNPEDPCIPSSEETILRLIGLAFRAPSDWECEVIACELRVAIDAHLAKRRRGAAEYGEASFRLGYGVLTLGDLRKARSPHRDVLGSDGLLLSTLTRSGAGTIRQVATRGDD